MTLLALILISASARAFVADASAEGTYILDIPRAELRARVDDIGLFQRNMPGVIDVVHLQDQTYLYRTEKEIPLQGMMSVDFRIRRLVIGDSLTIYRSVDVRDTNYMSCNVQLTPLGTEQTEMHITLRVRMQRENPAAIHWLAPVLGEAFVSDRMRADIVGMLDEFIRNSSRELGTQIVQAPVKGDEP
jgi:hypothetical protein